MNPYQELHDCLEQLINKRLGTSYLTDCAMGKILPEELRKYRSTVVSKGSDICWRSQSIEEALTPLGFTPLLAYEIERVNDRPGQPHERGLERYTRVMKYLKEKSE